MDLIKGRKYRSDEPDEILIARYIKTGDLDILGDLYTRYIPLVYGVCLKYLASRDDAKDGVTEIFEKIIVELERHRVEKFRPWLYVLTKNWCLMQLRSAKSAGDNFSRMVKERDLVMENRIDLHPLDRDNGIPDKVLNECIERLKEEQQSCIRLFYYDNRSYREVASTLNLDEKLVKSHLQNARRNLKICIEENYVTEE